MKPQICVDFKNVTLTPNSGKKQVSYRLHLFLERPLTHDVSDEERQTFSRSWWSPKAELEGGGGALLPPSGQTHQYIC